MSLLLRLMRDSRFTYDHRMDAIAIDFETANERRDSACAVGLAWIEDGRVVRRETRLIRPPELRFAPGNIRIHGILPADVRDQPNLPEAMSEFLPDLSDRLVLAHNAGFDMGVLAASLAAWGQAVPPLRYLCTLRVARQLFPDPAGCGLAKVAARLGIRFEHHDAGEDAYACAEIALAAMRESGSRSVSDLPRALGLPAIDVPGAHHPDPDAFRSTAPRALLAARKRPKASPGLRFTVRGSTGNRYEVTLEDRSFGLYLRCDCIAGRHRRRCRHVDAIIDGDVTDLMSGNFGDVERLRLRLAAADAPVEPSRSRELAEMRPPAGFA